MSEAELHILRARLNGGIRNKAARGDLRRGLPVGFARRLRKMAKCGSVPTKPSAPPEALRPNRHVTMSLRGGASR
jgi:hypothetical protein